MTEEMSAWADAVCRTCDPVFQRAGAGFHPGVVSRQDRTLTILWTADPETFLRRFPDSHVDESYGDQWGSVPDIDVWVKATWGSPHLSIDVEGSNLPTIYLALSAQPGRDAHALAVTFGRLLDVPDVSEAAATILEELEGPPDG